MVTAFLTVEDRVSVRWRGRPTKSILPEYGEWVRNCMQTVADSTGKRMLYIPIGTDDEPMIVSPQKNQEA